MDREGFLISLKTQYAEDILSTYFECQKENELPDIKLLTEKLETLLHHARRDGLRTHDFVGLVEGVLPSIFKDMHLQFA